MNPDYIAPREIDADWADVILVASCPPRRRNEAVFESALEARTRPIVPMVDNPPDRLASARAQGRQAVENAEIKLETRESRTRSGCRGNHHRQSSRQRSEPRSARRAKAAIEPSQRRRGRARHRRHRRRTHLHRRSRRQRISEAHRGRNTWPVFCACLRTIEDSAKPVVMAIHGAALGGGLKPPWPDTIA